MEPVINNEDMDINTFVYSDGEYDYCIVNGKSVTKYYGRERGQYESYCLHILQSPQGLLENNEWVDLLNIDYRTKKLYKYHKELFEAIQISTLHNLGFRSGLIRSYN
jgi:hypothetical protein